MDPLTDGSASPQRGSTPTSATPPAAAPSYLHGAPPSFLAQADVRFVAAGGCELPAHSQFLARSCLLFSELLDPEGGVQGRPTSAAPLRVALEHHSAAEIARTLHAVYHPHQLEALVAGLQGPAAYGAQLDIAAFLRFGLLLDSLRGPLSSRTHRMGEMVRFDFAAWLDVAERHDLASLRGYCLECMMHLLVAPGCTRQPDEPNIEQLDWDALSKADLLLLLDGLACGVRRCTNGSYDMRTRVPCAAASSPRAVASGPLAGSSSAAAAWPGLLPPIPEPPTTPGAQPTAPGSGARISAALARSDHLATVTVPKLRRADIAGSLPGASSISGWRRMGDMCRDAQP